MNMTEQVAELHLKRPLVFFDLETTGTKVGVDRIVEMAMVKLMPDGSVIKKPEAAGREHRILVNPEMPIPVESSLVRRLRRRCQGRTHIRSNCTRTVEVAPWL